jgi:Predicted periplasmic lipoprotein
VPSAHPPASALRVSGSRRWLPFLLAAFVILGLIIWKPPFVIRPLPSTKTGNSSTTGAPNANAATTFVDPIWDSKIVPAFIGKAVDAKELLAAIQENPEVAGEKFGRREATNPYNYLIKGTGQVNAVNTESRAGTLTIGSADAKLGQNVTVQIGPVVLGTAVRDATGIVSFNQFTNQIDYAGVSKEMNARAIREALGGKDPASFNGKQIRFVGAFTYDPHSAGNIRITPIKLEIQGPG